MSAAEKLLTIDQYLELDATAEVRSEFYAGQMTAMSGGSVQHARVAGNLFALIHAQLRGGPCAAFGSDLRIEVQETGLFTYADLFVVCGALQLREGRNDTVLNPTLIVEVLSPSTEAYDRGLKAEHYRRLPSLREHLLVAQDRPHVEHYQRRGDEWLLTEATGLDAVLELPSLGCRLALRDIYDGGRFTG